MGQPHLVWLIDVQKTFLVVMYLSRALERENSVLLRNGTKKICISWQNPFFLNPFVLPTEQQASDRNRTTGIHIERVHK